MVTAIAYEEETIKTMSVERGKGKNPERLKPSKYHPLCFGCQGSKTDNKVKAQRRNEDEDVVANLTWKSQEFRRISA